MNKPIAEMVDAFLRFAVAEDPVLRPMYPADLDPSRSADCGSSWFSSLAVRQLVQRRSAGILACGCATVPFPIDQRLRATIGCNHMLAAIDEAHISEPARSRMREYFERASAFLINRPEPGSSRRLALVNRCLCALCKMYLSKASAVQGRAGLKEMRMDRRGK